MEVAVREGVIRIWNEGSRVWEMVMVAPVEGKVIVWERVGVYVVVWM